ncbi:MAG: TonB-dependent receptor plug domain-containing protein, partial [Longimicrobiales bacterium]
LQDEQAHMQSRDRMIQMNRLGSVRGWLLAAGVAAVMASPGLGQAQSTGQITGTVSSEEGQPIPGATVTVACTGISALTNAGGRYLLSNVPVGPQTVNARVIGYGEETQQVSVTTGEVAQASFQLVSQAVLLEGIVVVGYGTQTRELVTGAVASVSGADLEAIPTTNLSNTLNGKLPGVMAVNASGELGANGSTIRVRGNHTLNDNSPLVVIDGVPDRAGGLERLNPEDIESVSVLKDASAAIYGSRAANGVILVTTKRGTQSGPQLSVNVSSGYTQPTRLPDMADAATYMTMLNETDIYRGLTPRYSDALIANFADPNADRWIYPNTDWYSEALETWASQSKGNVSLRGGDESISYFLSLGAVTEDGIYKNSATRYNQYNFRSNLDGRVGQNINIRFDLTGRLEDRNYPVRPVGTIFGSTVNGKPNPPARWPNGLPGPDIENGNNPVVIATPETG